MMNDLNSQDLDGMPPTVARLDISEFMTWAVYETLVTIHHLKQQ